MDFASITSHIHNWALFLLWLHLFILSGVISLLFSSSILGTNRPGEFIFQCQIFLPFHTVHGVLKQEYWSGLPFPSPVDHVLSELSTMTCPSCVALYSIAPSFIEWEKAVVHVISLVSFLWLWFSVCLPSDGEGIRGLWKPPDGRDWLRGKLGLVLMGGAMLSKSLIQFSVDGWSCVPSLLFTWGQTVVEVMKTMVTSFKRSHTYGGDWWWRQGPMLQTAILHRNLEC